MGELQHLVKLLGHTLHQAMGIFFDVLLLQLLNYFLLLLAISLKPGFR